MNLRGSRASPVGEKGEGKDRTEEKRRKENTSLYWCVLLKQNREEEEFEEEEDRIGGLEDEGAFGTRKDESGDKAFASFPHSI